MKTDSIVTRALWTLSCCALLFLGACGGGETIATTFAELAALCDQAEFAVTTSDELLPRVMSVEDQKDDTCGPGEPCTLRAAVNSAYVCRDHPDDYSPRVIRLEPEATYTIRELYVPSTLMKRLEADQAQRVGGVLLPRIVGNVVIEGEGSTIELGVELWGSRWARRYFHVLPGATLTLRDLTIRGARLGDPDVTDPTPPPEALEGSAIFNEGRLVLDEVTFIDNEATFAIYNRGSAVEASDCVFESNMGAISNASGGLGVERCRFVRNGHLEAGAVLVTGGSCWFRTSSFSANYSDVGPSASSAINASGGVLRLEDTTLENNGWTTRRDPGAPPVRIGGGSALISGCTLSRNGGASCSAVSVAAGLLQIHASTFFANYGGPAVLVADHPHARAILDDVTIHANEARSGGPVGLVVGGAGTIEIANSVFSNNIPVNCGFAAPPVIHRRCMCTDTSCPGAVVIGDPLFAGGLRDNGGPTATLLPSGGSITAGPSPLVDAGEIGLLPLDQRGLARPVGGGRDVGAVERQATDP